MHWRVQTDSYGTDFAVVHEFSHVTSFPLSSVMKRFEDDERRFFVPVAYAVEHQIRKLSEHWRAAKAKK